MGKSVKRKPKLKTYEAILHFHQSSRARVKIRAKSLNDAKERANEISADEVEEWNPVDGEVSVESVTENEHVKI